jgi:hypothetical protein
MAGPAAVVDAVVAVDAAGLSATRGGLTMTEGRGVSPAISNSLTP